VWCIGREEYLAEYPYFRQTEDSGLKTGNTFEVAARNSSTSGIDLATWFVPFYSIDLMSSK
jgi:hypothetical protein